MTKNPSKSRFIGQRSVLSVSDETLSIPDPILPAPAAPIMNQIPQTMALRNPSLTFYGFHLRNSINQGLEPTVAAAPRLWEELVDLGNALHIGELQTLRQELICYEGDRYFPEAEDIWDVEYFNLLENQEPSLRFQVPPQAGGLELQGLLCPFRLHDTYAIDLTLYSQDTFTLPQLNYLNPQNLILQNIQASLGQTLLLFGQPPETQQGNYQVLADACVAQLFPRKQAINLVDTGCLLGNPIFEYESGPTNPANKLHILVWLECQDMNPSEMDRVAEILLYLLWCRHKILYVYRQSRWCVIQAKKLYGSLDQYKSNFSQISEAPNRRVHLIHLQTKLQQLELDYANYLSDLEEHQQTIAINEENYKTYLERLEKLPSTKLSFCQDFLRHIRNKFQKQIQVDLDYLAIGRDRLQHLKATVQDTIAVEPNDPIKDDMAGVPIEIYNRLSEALLDCDQFDDAQTLRNFFKGHTPLRPWRHRWQASSPPKLVEDAIGFLNDKYHSDTNENALVLLVRLLAKRIDKADARHRTLTELAQELDTVLSHGSKGAANEPTANPNPKPKLSIVPNPTDNRLPETVPAVRFGQEANPQGESMSFLAVDEKLLTCARSVARVSVPKIIDGDMKQVPTGTGWLITPELALTCWHVIEARGRWDEPIRELDLQEQIANSLLIFQNKLPGKGVEYKIKELEYYNPDLDYALLRLQDRDAHPLEQWGFLKCDEDEPLTRQTKLLVIQHPKGQPQQRSGGYFVKNASNTNCILHNAPTEPGTSGAPVLKVNNWQVVALHNGENEAELLREATLISAILSDLRQNQKELHNEIRAAQHS
ncbi:MAG: hypothetical protein F6K21_02450 [Symploca sp. SIO2D2]|nr:hypothetical protein [Symploca sp. SIO2D2]